MKTNKTDLEIEREYKYKPSWLIILLCGGMFALAAVFFGVRANSNDRGLIINHIIELSENGATISYLGFLFSESLFCSNNNCFDFPSVEISATHRFNRGGHHCSRISLVC